MIATGSVVRRRCLGADVIEQQQTRRLICTCGHTLGTIARERRGPVTLTPAADTAFVGVTGAIVWLRCPACCADTPWFCASGGGRPVDGAA